MIAPALALAASTFGVIFLAELPDKTALASLVLATRYPARQVVFGAWLAFAVQTLVAVAAGSLLQLLPSQPVRLAAGAGFLVFAVLAWRRKEEEELREESAEVAKEARRRPPPWLGSFMVVFAAEWGDLTQLATAALVAQTRQPLPVGVGALAALWSVTVIAAVSGSQLGRLVTGPALNRVSAAVFAIVGISVIVFALRPA
ncbi:MAG: TMEM165/GDT1 family protein [Chloroflexota bacterium]|nr:TMEM165/GDT1 family protein [Chloroflexota bacterium]